MNVVILVNPISGRGRAEAAAEQLSEELSAAGHLARREVTRPEPSLRWLSPKLHEIDLLVVVGGDGAVRLAAPAAAAARVPIYHFPLGTENLFSREWSMTNDPRRLYAAMDRWDVRSVDMGWINGEPFVLMASVGFDAEVVEDLAAHRDGSIRHWSYALPILRQFARWQPPWLDVVVDGRTIAERTPGFVVIGNCRQYGMRLDPAVRADMADGKLDVVFYPCASRWRLLRWALATRARRHVRHPALLYERGEKVQVRSATPVRFQIDGDRPEEADPAQDFSAKVEAGVLQVLAPVV